MSLELAKAYVQIVPSAVGIKGKITEALGGEASSAGESFGNTLISKVKGIIASAGIGKAISSALNAGADLQQSFGGIETIYGNAAEAAKKYASEAVSAGISMNDYAEQAVSFGAALKEAFNGDMTKAAEAANTAIMDMADNSAKMGTDIESVQNAYQGFAKQNYTMLDNLKLGYGGTKSEMERLLAKAEELSGVEYNIDNLGDVYEAIHVIQEDLGITGVAADEASTTFSGSLAAMKAAGTNFLANLTLGEDIGPSLNALSETVFTFFTKNMIPMIGNILKGLPDALSGVLSMVVRGLNIATNNVDEIIKMGQDVVSGIIVGIISNLPYLAESVLRLVSALAEGLINADWIGMAQQMIETLKENLNLASFEILGTDESIISNICGGITSNLSSIVLAGGEVITQLVSTLLSCIPQILASGSQMILGLVQGILSEGSISEVINSAIEVIVQFLATIGEQLPDILQQGITIIGELIAGLISAIPDLLRSITDIIGQAAEKFLSYDWGNIGANIIEGIVSGIVNAAGSLFSALRNLASDALKAAKEAFDINSPSGLFEDFVGYFIPPGIAKGVRKNTKPVIDEMKRLAGITVDSYQPDFNSNILGNSNRIATSNIAYNSENGHGMNSGFTQNLYITSPRELSPSEIARQTKNANRQMILAMRGVV